MLLEESFDFRLDGCLQHLLGSLAGRLIESAADTTRVLELQNGLGALVALLRADVVFDIHAARGAVERVGALGAVHRSGHPFCARRMVATTAQLDSRPNPNRLRAVSDIEGALVEIAWPEFPWLSLPLSLFKSASVQVANIVWSERAVATPDNPGVVRSREWRDFGPEFWLAGG